MSAALIDTCTEGYMWVSVDVAFVIHTDEKNKQISLVNKI